MMSFSMFPLKHKKDVVVQFSALKEAIDASFWKTDDGEKSRKKGSLQRKKSIHLTKKTVVV